MLIVDGVKYNHFVPKDKKQLEEMIKEHAKDIFGEDTLYFDLKQKITSKSSIVSVPDACTIALSRPKWYVVEGELSGHPLHEQTTTELNKFYVGVKNPTTQRELADVLCREIDNDKVLRAYVESKIGSAEIKGFLLDLLSKPPEIVVVTGEKGDRVKGVCDGLKAEPIVIEFKTFVREDARNVHAHLFEPLAERPAITTLILQGPKTPQPEFTVAILESLIESGGRGKAGEILNKVFEKKKGVLKSADFVKIGRGQEKIWKNQARWQRGTLRKQGCLKKDSPTGIWEITDAGRKLYENLKQKA